MTAWRKSTYSTPSGDCVEAGNGWRKSTRSISGERVEAGNGTWVVLVRDTTDRDGAVLSFPAGAWARFTAGISGAGS